MDLYIEIFGYIGTALVLLSMMMSSVTKLRVVNIAGSAVSMTYAAICNTWPVVFLNCGLIIINSIQLVRHYRLRSFLSLVCADAKDMSVKYFFEHYLSDIKAHFPEFDFNCGDGSSIFLVFDGAEAVGILVGEIKDGDLHVVLDYSSPKYRDRSVASFLFEKIKEYGIKNVFSFAYSENHKKYLLQMGFEDKGEILTKKL